MAMKPASQRPRVIQSIPIRSLLTSTAAFLVPLGIRLGALTFPALVFRYVYCLVLLQAYTYIKASDRH